MREITWGVILGAVGYGLATSGKRSKSTGIIVGVAIGAGTYYLMKSGRLSWLDVPSVNWA